MSHELINHNEDLKQLQSEGYDVEIHEAYLIVNHIPYVGDGKQVRFGSIVSELKLAGNSTVKPDKHVALWVGDYPCDHEGVQLTNLVNESKQIQIRDGLVTSHSFSQKPSPEGYDDYYHKMTTYIQILQSHAQALDPEVTALAWRSETLTDEESVFCYPDSASNRAGITSINEKLKKNRVAIIGLGGTGSYVLDLIAKTPVEEIHLFDSDNLSQHNAFRSPGAPSSDDLRKRVTKVEWFAEIYSRMHKGIIPHPQRIDESNISELNSMTMVFLCVDNDESRRLIVDYLIENKITFIDVGIGLYNEKNALGGSVRITTCTPSVSAHNTTRIPYGGSGDNEYATNIQISEMNALNAALAVIKWKKMCKFYHDYECEHNALYQVATNRIANNEGENETKNN